MQISVNNIFWVGVGVALLVGVWSVHVYRTREKPNVLVIMIDTVRADHLGAYGYDKDTSPFLDSLFKKGVVFERAYTPAYLTFQTDAALFSGLYPSQNNVRTWTTPVRPEVPLLAEIFKLHGYETHAFVWSGLRDTFNLSRGYDTFTRNAVKDNLETSLPLVLETLSSSTKPVFLAWTIYDVHVPMAPAEEPFLTEPYNGPFASGRGFDWPGQSTSTITYVTRDGTLVHTKTDADYAYLRAQYDTGIRRVDERLADFFAEAKKRGLLQNTIVVITAEHGEELGERGFFFHRDVYETGIHVPLAIIAPERLAPRRVDTPVTLLDLAPTLTELAGIPRFEGGEGVSLVPLLEGKSIADRTLFVERHPFGEYAVMRWPWKLIVRDATRGTEGLTEHGEESEFFSSMRRNDVSLSHELYNLIDDPDETLNLFGRGVPVEEILRAEGEVFRTRMQAEQGRINIPDVSDETHFSYP